MKKISKIIVAVIFVIATTFTFIACAPIKAGGNLVINEDGSGTRTFEAKIDKNDQNNDGYGMSYNMFKKHGNDLKQWITDFYSSKLSDISFMTVEVNDANDYETITISFSFTSFEDYVIKTEKLVKLDGNLPETYVAPTFTTENGISTYFESAALTSNVYQPVVDAFVEDDTVFDLTADGENTQADKETLRTKGIEVGILSIKLGKNEAKSFDLKASGDVNYQVRMDGTPVEFVKPAPQLFLSITLKMI